MWKFWHCWSQKYYKFCRSVGGKIIKNYTRRVISSYYPCPKIKNRKKEIGGINIFVIYLFSTIITTCLGVEAIIIKIEFQLESPLGYSNIKFANCNQNLYSYPKPYNKIHFLSPMTIHFTPTSGIFLTTHAFSFYWQTEGKLKEKGGKSWGPTLILRYNV